MAKRATRAVLDRDTVLDTALALLLEHGPARLRLADLARRLGVVPSALHYHFAGGKDEVITAVFDREETRVLQSMTAAVEQGDTPRSRLLGLATARLGHASSLARLHRLDEGDTPGAARRQSPAAEIQDYVRHRRRGFLDRERTLISKIFRSAAAGTLSRNAADLLAAGFQGAMSNITRTFALTPSGKAGRVLAELVDVFFAGIMRHHRCD